jgi:hypothetical protein
MKDNISKETNRNNKRRQTKEDSPNRNQVTTNSNTGIGWVRICQLNIRPTLTLSFIRENLDFDSHDNEHYFISFT